MFPRNSHAGRTIGLTAETIMRRCPILLSMLLASPVLAAVDMQQLIDETQQVYVGPAETVVAWWLPSEFWKQTAVRLEGDEKLVDALDNYLIFAVAAAKTDESGELIIHPRDEILAGTQLTIDGRRVAPLAEGRLAPDIAAILTATKPRVAHALGRVGQGLEFLVFPNDSGPKISATEKGSLTITVFGVLFEWRPPLPSLLPPMLDTATGESFPGDFRYNPYSGGSLIPDP